MEQRRPRLGDILDDYCPRERRITNHAVVAMIEDEIKQTRCVTCDAEHEYKAAKVPPRRKKDAPAALYRKVLSGKPEDAPPDTRPAPTLQTDRPAASAPEPAVAQAAAAGPEGEPPVESAPSGVEDGPVHRPLIRATLPRIEGQVPVRPTPEFTIRQSGRNGNYRDQTPRGRGSTNGSRMPGAGGPRFPRQARSDRPGGPPFSQASGNRPPDRGPSSGRPPRPGRPARFGKKRSR
jgi:hypothetical protein